LRTAAWFSGSVAIAEGVPGAGPAPGPAASNSDGPSPRVAAVAALSWVEGTSPRVTWKRSSAAWLSGPQTPSARPVKAPAWRSFSCTAVTAAGASGWV
jgi:hypothetical protein